MNPRSKSSAVRFVGAALFLASALALGTNPHGSAIDAQKSDKSVKSSPRAKGAPSEDQQQPQPNTKSNRSKPEEQTHEELERPSAASEQETLDLKQQVEEVDGQIRTLDPRVQALDERLEKLQLFAIIALIAAVSSLILAVFIFLDRKHRVRDSYYEIESKNAQLNGKVATLANDVDAIRKTLRRDLSNFVTTESFEPFRRAFEQRQAERSLGMPNLRAMAPRTQFSDLDGGVQHPPVQVAPVVAAPLAPPPAVKQFADLPERDGTFKEGSLKSKGQWDSLYTLTIESPDNAIVEIYSDSERFEAAIKAPEQYLSPVCDYENNPLSSARSIRLLSPGRASHEGETWTVTKRLKIEFC